MEDPLLEPPQSGPTEANKDPLFADIIFSPPHWPQAIPSECHNHKISNQVESDYSLAARINDVLDTLDQQDKVDWGKR
jgi:hypothetical protein